MKETNTRKRTGSRKWFAVGGLGIIAGLLCFALLSGTLARYTYQETIQDSARVAVFKVSVGDGKETFRLFDNIYDSDGVSAEDDVAKDTTQAIIAPGTSGELALKLYNDSEVTVDYTVELTVGNTTIPLEFSPDRSDDSLWTKDLSTSLASGTMNRATDTNVTVYWRWAYDGDDTVDTKLGTDAQTDPATVEATATVTFVQKD